LQPSGEADVSIAGGQVLSVPVYQCDECIVEVDFMGEKMELDLTFAVGPDGKPFDPADPEGKLPI
jgi:hypothetical protein